MTCAVGGRGAGGAIAAALLALHVGLVSVEITNPPPRRALAAVGGGCAGRVSVEIAALQADCGWRLLRLRGGKKKEVKGKKIRQPRKLQQIAAAEDSSDEKQPDFFSSSLSFEQPGGAGRAGASAHAQSGVPALPPGAGAEGAQDDGDSSTGGAGGGGARAGAEGEAEAKGKRGSNIKLFDAPLAQRRPREDNFDEELYLEVASRKKVMLPTAPQTLGARMDDQAAAGWRAPYESPRQRIAREKAERAGRRAARGLKPTPDAHEQAGAARLETEKLAKTPRKEKAGKQGKKASRLSEGADEAAAAGGEGVARGVRKKEARDGKRDGITDKMFGMRAADFNDGEAFETRVGTSLVQDNLFYIPPHFEDEFVGSCNPDGALDKRKTQGQQQRSLRLAQGKALKERQKAKKIADELMIRGSAVLYVGHIPYGFYEEAQFQFFSQYGKVTRLRLSRDPKTNRYRGYGFVEFEDAAVAHEVCKEMNGYTMYGKRLRVHLVSPDKLHAQVFRNSHRKFVKIRQRAKKRALKAQNALLKQKPSDKTTNCTNCTAVGWEAVPSGDKFYFWNRMTNETTWEKPVVRAESILGIACVGEGKDQGKVASLKKKKKKAKKIKVRRLPWALELAKQVALESGHILKKTQPTRAGNNGVESKITARGKASGNFTTSGKNSSTAIRALSNGANPSSAFRGVISGKNSSQVSKTASGNMSGQTSSNTDADTGTKNAGSSKLSTGSKTSSNADTDTDTDTGSKDAARGKAGSKTSTDTGTEHAGSSKLSTGSREQSVASSCGDANGKEDKNTHSEMSSKLGVAARKSSRSKTDKGVEVYKSSPQKSPEKGKDCAASASKDDALIEISAQDGGATRKRTRSKKNREGEIDTQNERKKARAKRGSK